MSEQTDGGPAFPDFEYDNRCLTSKRPGMYLRQYAAIHLCVPDSGLDWLDAMIDRARRDEFAEKAMVALVSKFPPVAVAKNDPVYHRNARGGCNYADALLAELDKGVGQ